MVWMTTNWAPEQHEPRGGPEFESVHSGRDRPRLATIRGFQLCECAVVDDRNAQQAGGRGQLGEQVMTVSLQPFPVGTAT